jgi:N-acyl-D-amino-acid deacylase
LLSADSVALMHRRPPGLAGHEKDGKPKDVFYSLGWTNRDLGDGRFNRWHTGSLPGTATLLLRRHDERNIVALMNCRVSPHSDHLGREIDVLLNRAADAVAEWPTPDP